MTVDCMSTVLMVRATIHAPCFLHQHSPCLLAVNLYPSIFGGKFRKERNRPTELRCRCSGRLLSRKLLLGSRTGEPEEARM